MILDEFIEIKWHSSNKKYLTDLGYVYTGINTNIVIRVSDLKNGSHVKLHVKCDVCGNEKYLNYKTYNKNIKSGGYYGCSDKCSVNKYYNTNVERYGFAIPMKSEIVKAKVISTNIERYGVSSTLKLKVVQDKIKITTMKKYGVAHNSQNNEIKKRKHRLNVEKYGDDFFKTDEFKSKTKATNLKRYGVENVNQSEVIKQKNKATNLERYGVEYTMQRKDIREKVKQTMLERYGFEFLHQNKKIKEKAQNTMIEKYGELWLKHTPTYNANSIIYLDLLSENLGIPIRHALNGGEKKFVKYWVDGYIEEHNICIEWDEKYHNINKFKEKDKVREEFLVNQCNCCVIRINEKEFLRDVDNQIILITNKIIEVIKKIKEKHGK